MRGIRAIAAVVALAATLASPARPPGAQQRARSPVVYAWFPAQFGSWRTGSIRWGLITHVCYRSVVLKADGSLERPSEPPKAFVEESHRHGVKVTVLVWTNTPEDSDRYLANHPQDAANNLLAYVRQYGLDGVNIDDEAMHETNRAAGVPNRDLVTRFFRILARTLKRANPKYHISFAAPPVISAADRYGVSWLDMRAIAASVDAIIPMGYTMNPPSIGWTTNPEPLAGGGAAQGVERRDIETMVGDYLRAMGGHREKLLVGVSLGFGGYEWRCRGDSRLSPTLSPGKPRTLAECEAAARIHGRRRDDAQRSPWYAYQDGDAWVQGWYNDLDAWRAKLSWIRAQGLGGIGIWVLDGAADPPERWQVLRDYAGHG